MVILSIFSPIGFILNIPIISDRTKVILVSWYMYLVSMFSLRCWKREEEKEVRKVFPAQHLEELVSSAKIKGNELFDYYCWRKILRLRYKNGEPYGMYLKYPLYKKDKWPMKVCLRIAYYLPVNTSEKDKLIFDKLGSLLWQYKVTSSKRGYCLYTETNKNIQIWGNFNLVLTKLDEAYIELDVDSVEDFGIKIKYAIDDPMSSPELKKFLHTVNEQVDTTGTFATSV